MTVKPQVEVNEFDAQNAEIAAADPATTEKAVKAVHAVADGTLVSVDLLKELVGPEGYFFSVHFIKRTTGELREMNCRFGVKSRLRGGQAAYNAKEKNLLCVFDPRAENKKEPKLEDGTYPRTGDYRSIAVENLTYFRAHGVAFNVMDGKLYRAPTAVVVDKGEVAGIGV